MPVKTVIFMYAMNTGVPYAENYDTKLTEIALIAVNRENILIASEKYPPLEEKRLSFCINPGKKMQFQAMQISNLDDWMLLSEPEFDERYYNLIKSFVEGLEKPVCIVSHHGKEIDFPVLQNYFKNLNKYLPKGVLYSDTVDAFKYYRCYWKNDVKIMYYCFFNKMHDESLTAEDLCEMLMKCTLCKLSTRFLHWVDKHSHPFSEIVPMKIGVPYAKYVRKNM